MGGHPHEQIRELASFGDIERAQRFVVGVDEGSVGTGVKGWHIREPVL